MCAQPLPGKSLRALEEQVIASLAPELNVVTAPSAYARPCDTRSAWGPFTTLREASEVLGVSIYTIQHWSSAMSYEDWLDYKINPMFVEGSNMRKRVITCEGESNTINGWAEKIGVSPAVIHSRLHIGWTPRQAVGLDPPPGAARRAIAAAKKARLAARRDSFRVCYGDFEGSRREAAEKFGVEYATLSARINAGWPIEQVLGIEPRGACRTLTNPTELPARCLL